MKWIRLNNYLLFVKIFFLAVALSICACVAGQNTSDDTSSVQVTTDTVITEELPNYFENKNGNAAFDTIELRHVPGYVMDSLKNDDAFWYANTRFKKKIEKEHTGSTTPRWVKTLTWIFIVGAFFAALIWYLATSNIVIFAKRQKHIENKGQGETPEDIFSIDYQREIDRAVREEDYRLATRLMFLRLLRNLSNQNLIQYRQGRTNLEYLAQLFSTVYYNDFFRLTRNYEYAWYGRFDVSRDAFKTIRSDFENFDHQLK